MNYAYDSGLDNSIESPFCMEDYVVFPNQNLKQECLTGNCNTNQISEVPIDSIDELIRTDTSDIYFSAQSSTESGYSSSSDGYLKPLIPLPVELISANNSASYFYQAKSVRTTKRRKQPQVSTLEFQSPDSFTPNKRGRPLQDTKVYDDEIKQAVYENNFKKLKIARNKKSSQIYRLKKKYKALRTVEKDEKYQMKKCKLINKLNKYIEDNLKLKEYIRQLNNL